MSQEIEIEYKVLLPKDKYEQLAKELPFPKEPITQINYYFETKHFDLKTHRSALRIREKNGHYFLTLKEPHEEGILETHDELSKIEFRSWIDGNPVPKPYTEKRLNHMGISVNELIYYGSLTTERKTYTDQNIRYFLDKSFYDETIDYELEIEAPTKELGLEVFQSILEQYQIKKLEPITKIERFFHSYKSDN